MSGLGVTDYVNEQWAAFERKLDEEGYEVIHCAHCDRSARHPSCRIVRKEDPVNPKEPTT